VDVRGPVARIWPVREVAADPLHKNSNVDSFPRRFGFAPGGPIKFITACATARLHGAFCAAFLAVPAAARGAVRRLRRHVRKCGGTKAADRTSADRTSAADSGAARRRITSGRRHGRHAAPGRQANTGRHAAVGRRGAISPHADADDPAAGSALRAVPAQAAPLQVPPLAALPLALGRPAAARQGMRGESAMPVVKQWATAPMAALPLVLARAAAGWPQTPEDIAASAAQPGAGPPPMAPPATTPPVTAPQHTAPYGPAADLVRGVDHV